ncbi:hypothetical protein GCK72_003700 [Caenorhabditis remanei]|uniref:Uncharacterized protein n=1 Tax=Caenorhabditis remanei TaxID=31234 RepID=A0A6A5H9A1_CAERE|nr:hypothetical protein GCK72_003700 [Caenorhabditis remanei]KAF1763755.1 hypothetical protein GCK72_003700 [Caenorhabditis remanei]
MKSIKFSLSDEFQLFRVVVVRILEGGGQFADLLDILLHLIGCFGLEFVHDFFSESNKKKEIYLRFFEISVLIRLLSLLQQGSEDLAFDVLFDFEVGVATRFETIVELFGGATKHDDDVEPSGIGMIWMMVGGV